MKLNIKKFFEPAKIKDLLGFDMRSLGLARVALALIVIVDLIIRLTDFKAFYTNEGVLPYSHLRDILSKYFITVTLTSGFDATILVLFILGLGSALFLLIGYKTRLANIILWLVLITIHGRNPFVLQADDVLLRMFLFWGMFLPWGKIYSIDAKISKEKVPVKIFSIPTIAFIVQLVIIYVCTAILKTGDEWRSEGSAVYYALNIDQMATPVARFLLKLPYSILKLMTHSVFLYEALGPILLFIPLKKPSIRTFAIFGFMAMHFGFGLGLTIGNFSYILIAGFIALLPAEFWDFFQKLSRGFKKSLKLKIDKFINPHHLIEEKIKKTKINLIVELIAGIILIYVIVWNVTTLPSPPFQLSEKLRIPAYVLRLDQKWDMFAPYPLRNDGWYVIEGGFSNGQTKELLGKTTSDISYTKPEWGYKKYKNNRWRKYMMNLSGAGWETERKYYANYVCGQWNDEAKTLEKVRIVFVEEITLPEFEYSSPTPYLLLEHDCPTLSN